MVYGIQWSIRFNSFCSSCSFIFIFILIHLHKMHAWTFSLLTITDWHWLAFRKFVCKQSERGKNWKAENLTNNLLTVCGSYSADKFIFYWLDRKSEATRNEKPLKQYRQQKQQQQEAASAVVFKINIFHVQYEAKVKIKRLPAQTPAHIYIYMLILYLAGALSIA